MEAQLDAGIAAGSPKRAEDHSRGSTRGAPRLLIAVGICIWIVRGFRRLEHPTFWAEDGLVFFTQETESGWRSITSSYSGYLHLVPRLSAVTLGPLPVSTQLRGYEVIAVLVSLAILALVLNPRLAWLLPTRFARAATFVLLSAMPGVWETYGNVANLIFFGGIGLTLIALAEDARSTVGRAFEWLAVVLLGLSGPDVAMVIPLFGYRLWRTRTRNSAVLLLTAVATAATQYVIFLSSSRATADTGSLVTEVRELLERVVGALLVGDSSTGSAWAAHIVVVEVAWLLVVAALTMISLRGTGVALMAMVLMSFSSAAYVYGSIGFTYPNAQRHFMLPRVLLLVMITASLSHLWRSRSKRRAHKRLSSRNGLIVGLSVCLAASTGGVLSDLTLAPFGPTPSTAAFQRCLSTGRTVICRLNVAPRHFVIQIPKGQ